MVNLHEIMARAWENIKKFIVTRPTLLSLTSPRSAIDFQLALMFFYQNNVLNYVIYPIIYCDYIGEYNVKSCLKQLKTFFCKIFKMALAFLCRLIDVSQCWIANSILSLLENVAHNADQITVGIFHSRQNYPV